VTGASAHPTILEVADEIGAVNGKPVLTPRWEAVARAFYGLELRDQDIDNLAASTTRTKAELRRMAAELGIGRRRFNELWCRVGRRGRKSFVAALMAVYEAVYGGHERYILHGEQGLIAVISKDTAGSNLVAKFAELHAQALGFETNWTTIGNIRVLELEGVPFGIACFPCSGKAPRGYAIPVVIADEIAHWAIDDEYVNADVTVLGGVRPALAQFPDSKIIAISSPLGEDGLHFQTCEENLGDDGDPSILAVEGPTWEWNPEITEARTHEIEKDPKRHAMEFGALPGQTVTVALDARDLNDAFDRDVWGKFVSSFFTIDASSLRGDAFTWLAGRETDEGELVVQEVGGWEGDELRRVSMATIVETIADKAKEYGARTIYGDQREEAALRALFAEHDITLISYAWSEPSKDEAVMLLRRLMREAKLSLCEHATMRRELTSMKARLMPSGRTRYETNGLDYASALITLAHAAVAGEVLVGDGPSFAEALELTNRAADLSGDDNFHWSGSQGFG
jgi:hypothetical protein